MFMLFSGSRSVFGVISGISLNALWVHLGLSLVGSQANAIGLKEKTLIFAKNRHMVFQRLSAHAAHPLVLRACLFVYAVHSKRSPSHQPRALSHVCVGGCVCLRVCIRLYSCVSIRMFLLACRCVYEYVCVCNFVCALHSM